MIIICPCGDKRFEVDESLIPEKGRLLKCGSCDQTWFFDKKKQINDIVENIVSPSKKVIKKTHLKPTTKKSEFTNINTSKISNNKGSEIVKYRSKKNFTFKKFIYYIIVAIITFIGLILILDTFKTSLYNIFPNLEFFLFSLYEILKDIELFVKDLI